jgi:hypothetical protein
MKMPGRKMVGPLVVVVGVALAAVGLADQPPHSNQDVSFLRLTRDDDQSPVALEAAIVRFAPEGDRPGALTVDLIAAVHAAEKSYYEELNRLFPQYDAVLYELVAPPGTRIPQEGGRAGRNPVSLLQTTMTDVLGLEFQLDAIDYTRENMVHADMSPEQFAESMRRRGESVFQVFFRMMGYAMARQGQDPAGSSDLRLLLALFDKNRSLAMKRVLAEQFMDLEGSLTAIDGPQGSTLIAERNKVAVEVLGKQVAAGKRKLAIFYGAGHMFDFRRRLGEEFGLVPVSTRWLVAWDLKAKAASPPADSSGSTSADAPSGKRQRLRLSADPRR